jgi:hypothetical protein
LEVPVRKRLKTAAVAALLAVVASMTLASASSPRTNGPDVDAAQVTQPTIAPIQQLSLSLGKERFNQSEDASTESVARVGEKVGQVAGFCHLHS